jgi:alkylation response protein AidB-like acyl-CoA dehydrogenase
VLSGEKTHVLWGHEAGLVIVPAKEPGGGVGLFAVRLPAAGVSVERELVVDLGRRTARIAFHGARVPAASRLDGDGRQALAVVFVFGALLTSAEMLGAADAVFELTRRYACDRVQFGKPIGAFQAVKHPLVDTMIAIEQGRSLLYGAAGALAGGSFPDGALLARMCKAHASDTLAFAVQKAVQLHGGFGFTWDADVHFFFKRMLATSAAFGDATHHRRRLAARLFGPLPGDP